MTGCLTAVQVHDRLLIVDSALHSAFCIFTAPIRIRISVLRFLAHRWFLIALTTLFVVGLFGAAHLRILAEEWSFLRKVNLFAVMFITALPLEARSIWRTLKRPLARPSRCR
jgi:hypothetical protein